MGKDFDDACCESCRQFGGVDAVLPEPPPAIPIRAGYEQVRIEVRERGGPAREVIPTGPEVRVGRTRGNDVVLPSGAISKRQCRFLIFDDRVVVEDTKSGCGTYVDGRKVNTAELAEIHVGSVVNVGDFELRITLRRDQ